MAKLRTNKSPREKARSSAKKPQDSRASKPAARPVKGGAKAAKGGAKAAKGGAKVAKGGAKAAKGGAKAAKGGAKAGKGGAKVAKGGAKVAKGGVSKALRAVAKPSLAKTTPKLQETVLSLLQRRLGRPDPDLRDAIFDGVDDDALIEIGARIDSADILREVPPFASAALAIEQSLTTAQRENLLLSPGILAVLIGESQKLEALLGAPQAAPAPAGRASRAELREALALRNNVTEALRNALGAKAMAKADELLAAADPPERLGAGMEQLATFIEELLRVGDRHEHVRLKAFHLTAGRVQLLRDAASRLRVKAREASRPAAEGQRETWSEEAQRKLDLQDGRVVELIERVLRAFRAARRQDRSIRVPELRYIGWLFDAREKERTSQEEG